MKKIDDIEIPLDHEEALEMIDHGDLRIRKRVEWMVDETIEEAQKLVKPRILYDFLKIKKRDGKYLVLENDKVFESDVLVDKLWCSSEVVLYIATIGPKLEMMASEYFVKGEYLRGWVLDNVGTYALRVTTRYLQDLVEAEREYSVSRFSPGQNYWDITQQKTLFDILPSMEIGVELTPYLMMKPKKSVSGIMGHTEKKFEGCMICDRFDCDYRRAEYEKDHS
ncbi:MAG: hypothetical protein GTO23_08225 [Nitrososphaeria archaeon]|nr:hypothetical protein [Nitrososphaeria archaeon]